MSEEMRRAKRAVPRTSAEKASRAAAASAARGERPESSPPLLATGCEARSAEELAMLAKRDHLAAYDELVRRFEARLFNFLLRRVGHRAMAQDLTQEAFVRAWERIESYDPTWRFSTWLFTIAARLAISEFRRTNHATSIESVGFALELHEQAQGGPEEENQREGAKLWALARLELGDEAHTALWLRYAEDMSIGEIAKVLGRTDVGVRVTLFRARRTLAAATDRANTASCGTAAQSPAPMPVKQGEQP